MPNNSKKQFKIKGANFFKGKSFFAFLTAVSLLVIAYVIIMNILFLGKQLNNAYNINVNRNNAVKFDTEGFQKLNLVR